MVETESYMYIFMVEATTVTHTYICTYTCIFGSAPQEKVIPSDGNNKPVDHLLHDNSTILQILKHIKLQIWRW